MWDHLKKTLLLNTFYILKELHRNPNITEEYVNTATITYDLIIIFEIF